MKPDPVDRKNMHHHLVSMMLLGVLEAHTRTCRGIMGSHVCMECTNLYKDPRYAEKLIIAKTVLEQED